MNCCRETVQMDVPAGNRAQRRRLRRVPGNHPAVARDWTRGVPERYVAGCDTQGRPEGRLYPRSQQVIHETSGLGNICQRHGTVLQRSWGFMKGHSRSTARWHARPWQRQVIGELECNS